MKLKKNTVDVLLDGSKGEGGGQILRSALSLSAITGKSFQLDQIRAGRARPGLMRQHLTCVEAIADLCQAKTSEVSIGAEHLIFHPGKIRARDTTYAIGTAGSVSLLAQTVLPVLLFGDSESTIFLEGGTHALNAPGYEYLAEIFVPQIKLMNADVDIELQRYGFFPAGGGRVCLRVKPSHLRKLGIGEDVSDQVVTGEVINTPSVPIEVAEKEFKQVERKVSLAKKSSRVVMDAASPGNVLILRASDSSQNPGTLVSVCGAKNKRAEQVAKDAVRLMKRYLNSPASVDEFLADQLLLPMALAGGGEFTAAALTPHFDSNVDVIEQFLPINISTTQLDRFAWKVIIQSK